MAFSTDTTNQSVEGCPEDDHGRGEEDAGDEVLRSPSDVAHEGDGDDVADGEADLQEHREHVAVEGHVRLLEDVHRVQAQRVAPAEPLQKSFHETVGGILHGGCGCHIS